MRYTSPIDAVGSKDFVINAPLTARSEPTARCCLLGSTPTNIGIGFGDINTNGQADADEIYKVKEDAFGAVANGTSVKLDGSGLWHWKVRANFPTKNPTTNVQGGWSTSYSFRNSYCYSTPYTNFHANPNYCANRNANSDTDRYGDDLGIYDIDFVFEPGWKESMLAMARSNVS